MVFKVLFDGVLSSRECLVNGLCENCENKRFFECFQCQKTLPTPLNRHGVMFDQSSTCHDMSNPGASRENSVDGRSAELLAYCSQEILSGTSFDRSSLDSFAKKIIFFRTFLQKINFQDSFANQVFQGFDGSLMTLEIFQNLTNSCNVNAEEHDYESEQCN